MPRQDMNLRVRRSSFAADAPLVTSSGEREEINNGQDMELAASGAHNWRYGIPSDCGLE